MPARSLKRSRRCGARSSGVCVNDAVALATEVAGATGVAGATEVSEDELPDNSRTVDEIGWVRSPVNTERNTGSLDEVFVVVDANAIVTGVTVLTSGKLDR